MKQWNELEVFKNVDLEDSFVIGWKLYGDTFFIDMEASLWPGHPDYEKPKNGEYTCYKKARLVFRTPSNVVGLLPMSQVEPNQVLEGEIPDYDTVDVFQIENDQFRLTGKFGDVSFMANDWAFKVAQKLVP